MAKLKNDEILFDVLELNLMHHWMNAFIFYGELIMSRCTFLNCRTMGKGEIK